MLVVRVDSLAGTHAVAAAVAGLARTGDIIVLAGEMGAGKTAFAQGFGRALGITGPITSPTFTLVHSYPYGHRCTLHHADLYRLDSSADVEDLALDELAEFGGIVLVEWGDVAAATLGEHLEIRIEHDDAVDAADPVDADADEFGADGARLIEFTATGQRWAGRWERLANALAPYRVGDR